VKLTLQQVAEWVHAEGEFAANDVATGYAIDSRTVAAGELFFAVRGERFDGHDFVAAALANGAVAAVVSVGWVAPESVDRGRLLRVPDAEAGGVLAVGANGAAALGRARDCDYGVCGQDDDEGRRGAGAWRAL
jgi:UDP-N-acetylmuramoyl-tripeptide--D-alanyl-D-alanine ligase